ncbi:DUF6961 family protein [Sphingomonas endolithica]
MVERQHGDGAPALIAERVTALASAGDMKGVARWEAIAACYDQLRQGGRQ